MGKKARLKELRRAGVVPGSKPEPALPPSPWAAPVIFALGAGYIVTSLIQMQTLSDSGHYRYLFQDTPEAYIRFRYAVSWTVRWLGLVIGIGLLFRKEIFRKAAVVLALGTIVTAYWKHPYAGFLRHIRFLNEQMGAMDLPFSPAKVIQMVRSFGISGFDEAVFARISVVAAIGAEIFMALLVLFFATRSFVKARFR